MMKPRGEYGVGVESIYHTYIYTALDATDNLFQSGDDRGRMARGLWEAYTATTGMNDTHEVNQKTIARLPTLLLRTQLAQLGIQLEQHMNQTEAARRAKIEQTLANLGGEQPNSKPYEAMGEPRHMTAFWDIGLCELSDFTDFLGTRIMTYTELKARHKGKVITGRHRKSFTLLCAHLGCTEGEELGTAHYASVRKV